MPFAAEFGVLCHRKPAENILRNTYKTARSGRHIGLFIWGFQIYPEINKFSHKREKIPYFFYSL